MHLHELGIITRQNYLASCYSVSATGDVTDNTLDKEHT